MALIAGILFLYGVYAPFPIKDRMFFRRAWFSFYCSTNLSSSSLIFLVITLSLIAFSYYSILFISLLMRSNFSILLIFLTLFGIFISAMPSSSLRVRLSSSRLSTTLSVSLWKSPAMGFFLSEQRRLSCLSHFQLNLFSGCFLSEESFFKEAYWYWGTWVITRPRWFLSLIASLTSVVCFLKGESGTKMSCSLITPTFCMLNLLGLRIDIWGDLSLILLDYSLILLSVTLTCIRESLAWAYPGTACISFSSFFSFLPFFFFEDFELSYFICSS